MEDELEVNRSRLRVEGRIATSLENIADVLSSNPMTFKIKTYIQTSRTIILLSFIYKIDTTFHTANVLYFK